MEKTKWPAISGLVLGTIWLSRSIPTTFAFDKPLLSTSIILFSFAFAIQAVGRFLRRVGDSRSNNKDDDSEEAVPLNYLGQDEDNDESHVRWTRRTLRGRSQRVTKILKAKWISIVQQSRLHYILLGAIVLRVEILRLILKSTACAGLSWQPLIPLAYACWRYWTSDRVQKRADYEERPDDSIYDGLGQRIVRSRYRYLVSVGVISFGGLIAMASTHEPQSTFICAPMQHRWLMPFLQRSGSAFDVIIGHCIATWLNDNAIDVRGNRGKRPAARVGSLGSVFLKAALLSTIWSAILFIIYWRERRWVDGLERWLSLQPPAYYIWSLIKLDVLLCVTLVCALLSIQHIGLLSVSVLCTFVSVCTITTSTAWQHLNAYPPTQHNTSLLAILVMMAAFATYFYLTTTEHRISRGDSKSVLGASSSLVLFRESMPGWFYLGILLFLFLRATIWAYQSGNTVAYHPIDMLIYEAQTEHETYLRNAAASTTLDQAVENYRQRYTRYPPPGFDDWYRYATERNSVVIDDYDSIQRDLEPFWALPAQEIRDRTKLLLQNRRHEATAISIRDGNAAIGSHVSDDHRWMMESLERLINTFAEWLPDMDVAFNINDESRIAVPWQDLENMQTKARRGALVSQPQNKFSTKRAVQWEPIPELTTARSPMIGLGWQPNFNSHGNSHCPSGSPARTERHWNRGQLCTNCADPYSMGLFPANWTQTSDICHQPDLADLHGFYTSPVAFTASHELLPLFSQSRAPGFNDILYPSGWNWASKVEYGPTTEYPDVPFLNKNSSLFWRGFTTEGMSPDTGRWRGHSRQRFVHILNDINTGEATTTIPLPYTITIPPDTKTEQQALLKPRYAYTSVLISTLTSLVPTDVGFTGFGRCWFIDCTDEEAEFHVKDRLDFQAHWQHQYLLDLDGAGFSGRFLPFLHSRSLPFKASLFREWWDDRLTAWQHFVPLDLRAHGVWATLVYFAGLQGKVNGKEVRLKAHDTMGERIAENGRDWAGKVLRKEDMEIYFFRLLLEWGRLTDDARDVIGFAG